MSMPPNLFFFGNPGALEYSSGGLEVLCSVTIDARPKPGKVLLIAPSCISPCEQCGQPGPGWCHRDGCPRYYGGDS